MAAKAKKTTATASTEVAEKNAEKVVENVSEPTFSKAEVEAMIKQATAAALEQYKATQPTVNNIQLKTDETVTLLFIGAIAQDTVVSLGKIGQINRGGGTLDVPKREFLQNINGLVQRMLDSRKLIVINGFTNEERERYGVKYAEGELLSQNAYFKLLDYTKVDLCNIFYKLCDSHKVTVAQMLVDAYMTKHDNRINQELVMALDKLSKGTAAEDKFKPVLKYIAKEIEG